MIVGITGGSGFIGKMLVSRHLEVGDEVHVLSRKSNVSENNVIYHQGDLSDLESLEFFLKGIDVLYHCAAEISDDTRMVITNVEGTKNLLSVAAGEIKHWVQLSSVGVYGPIYSGVITELQDYNPVNLYEKTKLESDLLILEATNNNVFTSTIIRPSNVFGATMRNQSIFHLVKSIDLGLYFFIGKVGASANYVTAEDVVEALFLAGTNANAKNQIFNVSNYRKLEDFIGLIAEELGRSNPKFRVSKKLMVFFAKITSFIPRNPITASRINALTNRSIYSTDKIKSRLNFSSVYSVESGLKELIKEYKVKRK